LDAGRCDLDIGYAFGHAVYGDAAHGIASDGHAACGATRAAASHRYARHAATPAKAQGDERAAQLRHCQRFEHSQRLGH